MKGNTMLKRLFVALMALLMLLSPALSEEGAPFLDIIYAPKQGDARDLTPFCTIKADNNQKNTFRLTDRDYDTRMSSEGFNIYTSEKAYGIYICFDDDPKGFRVYQYVDGTAYMAEYPADGYLHQYIPLDGATQIRVEPSEAKAKWFSVKEVYVLSQGNIPRYVQVWEQPDNTCDIMVLFAHPDDEMLFFGGVIPYFAGELKQDVVAAVITPSNKLRKSELLNALWAAGMRNYPVMGPFSDKHSKRLNTAYEYFGKKKVRGYVVELFRKYRPETVLTHDIEGEYGHGMHRMCADAAIYAFDAAADSASFPNTAAAYGTHGVKKLYVHLSETNPEVFDWDMPLEYFNGLTGFEVAQAAYSLHKSQHRYEQFNVEPKDSKYSCYHFGLHMHRD
jgi:LmbE family N-acetylglucosaminyl deacetylase